MEASQKDIIELRSEEVQEIMGQVPSWILRWGITLVGMVIVGFAIGSYFFKYPDTLMAEVTVTTASPPIEMYARTSGRLEYISVRHLQKVDTGEVLAVVENTADFNDVKYIGDYFHQWQEGRLDSEVLYRQLLKHKFLLGDLQPSFAAFLMALNKDLHHHQEQYYPQKIDLKARQRKERESIELVKNQERTIHHQTADISRTMFLRDSALFTRKLISEEEYNQAEQTYLQSREIVISDVSTERQLELERLSDTETMLDLRQQYWLEGADVMLSLNSATEQLENAIREYERMYVLRSPITATVNMMGSWKRNQHVEAGNLLIILIPTSCSKTIGRAKLPATGAGKIKTGQTVKVRLTNYPEEEFGYVLGKVSAVSAIPDKESNYYLEIDFPQGLHTNYGKDLPESRQLVGTAEIVVKNKRLIENFIQPLEKIFRDKLINFP